jgi:hypothetical protein
MLSISKSPAFSAKNAKKVFDKNDLILYNDRATKFLPFCLRQTRFLEKRRHEVRHAFKYPKNH